MGLHDVGLNYHSFQSCVSLRPSSCGKYSYKPDFVVGDEDQSIYSWRGANIDNLFNFTKDFSNCKILKLERNYRSTKNILKRANMLIKNNSNRLDKQLYTENEEGSEISYTSLTTEADEADFVIRKINMLLNSGVPHKEIAILMRLNALSRPFEDRLLAYNIPYRIYGGFKFYERAEIKNVLAYLVAVANPLDNNNIARIINFPKRKIGDSSIKKMEEVASQYSVCLKTVILGCENFPELPNSLKQKLMPLKTLLENTRPHLINIKSKLGSYNEYYIKISTSIAMAALHNIIEEVNNVQKEPTIDVGGRQIPISALMDPKDRMNKIKNTLQSAWQTILMIDALDMDPQIKNDRYNTNRTILKGMCLQVRVSTSNQQRAPIFKDVKNIETLVGKYQQHTQHKSTNYTQPSKNKDNSVQIGWTVISAVLFLIFIIIIFSVISSAF